MNRKYYIIRTSPVVELDYTDKSTKQPRTFEHWRAAFKYGRDNIGLDKFEVVRMIRVYPGHPEPRGVS